MPGSGGLSSLADSGPGAHSCVDGDPGRGVDGPVAPCKAGDRPTDCPVGVLRARLLGSQWDRFNGPTERVAGYAGIYACGSPSAAVTTSGEAGASPPSSTG